ncbi:MAG TPA: tRNA dimethylallyltransferase, partial [Candidatus Eisenbacteria bacterium]|nr:tRNA dimethylallyltransferase [Candidatus Eisenbacteria bacterium]
LHARLAAIDPASAGRLHPRDRQRVSRALEVHATTGKPLTWWLERTPQEPLRDRGLVIEIVVEPRVLRERIARRTAWMMDQGLVEETRALIASGGEEALRRLRAIGYDEAMEVNAGRMDRDAARARIDLRTAQLAKRQRTWFRHQVEAVRIDATATDDAGIVRSGLAAIDSRHLTH